MPQGWLPLMPTSEPAAGRGQAATAPGATMYAVARIGFAHEPLAWYVFPVATMHGRYQEGMVHFMNIVYDDSRMRVTIVIEPVFRAGMLSGLIARHVTDGIREVVIDTRWIEIMHSPLLGEFVQVYCHLQKQDIALILCNVSEANRKLFRYTRLNELITVE
ncbi:MAG: STAS domain-containing protein [Planctomycetota bacterium]